MDNKTDNIVSYLVPPALSSVDKTNITFYFGSESGTAEGFARVLVKEAKKHGMLTPAVFLYWYGEVTLLLVTCRVRARQVCRLV